MKICFITKYPPIEGGESSKAYWLIKGLGERGQRVFTVTNAWEVEDPFRENIKDDDLKQYQPKNVKVYNTDPFTNPHFIPFFKPYTEKLTTLAIDAIKRFDIDLIDSWYILPYVIAGYITKTITNRPQILRHAGSDITRLFESKYLNTLFIEIFQKVNKIVTYPGTSQIFLSLGIPKSNLFLNRISVDTNAFNPNIKPFVLYDNDKKQIEDIPIITYIGKIGRTKGIFEMVKALSKIKEDFRLLLVANGEGTNQLKNIIKKNKLGKKTIFLGFVPPWNIPHIMKASTCIVLPEYNFPVKIHTPILPREAMATGTCVIMSGELHEKRAHEEIKDEVNTIVIKNPANIKDFTNKLRNIIRNPDYAHNIGMESHKISQKIENFDEYINRTINLYKEFGD